MKRVPDHLLRTLAERLEREDRDEMALPSYLHSNPALRFMAWRRVEVIAHRLAKLLAEREAPRSALDFGCGSGVLFPELRDRAERIYGVDLVLTGAEYVTSELQLKSITLIHPREMEAVVPQASVDVVVAMEVLEHVDDVAQTLSACRRLLKPTGRLLVSLPTENAAYRFGRLLAGFSGHYHHSNAATLDGELRRLGWKRTWRKHIPAPGPLCIYWAVEYEPCAEVSSPAAC